MINQSEYIKSLPVFKLHEDAINKWYDLEHQYHKVIYTKIENYISTHHLPAKKKNLSTNIVACVDGLYIIREIMKNNSSAIFLIYYNGSVQEYGDEFNLKKFKHIKIANKVKFYSLQIFQYSELDNYNVESEAMQDFEAIISSEVFVDDIYIRSVLDAIDLGIYSDFERGQFIFRGQVNDKWDLSPKLFREHKEDAIEIELALFETLLLGVKNPYANTFDPIEHLMNLQHFGIPTRLLDWTSDILIALFFSCYDPEEKNVDENGNLFIIDRNQYSPFDVHSSKNKFFKEPITQETVNYFRKRLQIIDIHIFEPVIKNPRLRVQDGCFMYFPLVPLDINNKKFVTLNEYISAKNNQIDSENINDVTKNSKIWIGNKKVEKIFKQSILKELEEQYGISKSTLFIEIRHIDNIQNYYIQLFEKAKEKTNWLKIQRKL
jgi:hypothetical protein